MTTEDLADGRLYYLATPYTSYPEGMTEAHKIASIIAARMIERGVMVYSPIAHGHPIATLGGLPRDADSWKNLNHKIMEGCDGGVVVAMMDGWEASAGIADELATAEWLFHDTYWIDRDGEVYDSDPRQKPEETDEC